MKYIIILITLIALNVLQITKRKNSLGVEKTVRVGYFDFILPTLHLFLNYKAKIRKKNFEG